MPLTLSQIASLLNLPAPAIDMPISGVNSLIDASPTELSFLASDHYLRDFAATKAAAVIVQKKVKLPPNPPCPIFLVDDADLAVAKVLEKLAPPVPRPVGLDPSARIAPTAALGRNVAVAHHVTVGQRASIGQNSILHPGVFIGDDVVIGDDCELFPNVVIRERCILGSRVSIHAGSIVGSDGFGYRWDGQKHAKIPQIGTVIIEDDVEIGSCTCIDRAKFGATRIGQGTKIDNLVQVAHNVVTGKHCILVGQSGIAGSTVLGNGVVLGGQAAVKDHITIGDGAMAAACSAVLGDVEPRAIISGMPALPHRQSLREQAALRDLPNLRNRVKALEEKLAKLTPPS
jgi:UDP-3-O-[3-hydroxymyristoyl] glucosamine N-acyltransferase